MEYDNCTYAAYSCHPCPTCTRTITGLFGCGFLKESLEEANKHHGINTESNMRTEVKTTHRLSQEDLKQLVLKELGLTNVDNCKVTVRYGNGDIIGKQVAVYVEHVKGELHPKTKVVK